MKTFLCTSRIYVLVATRSPYVYSSEKTSPCVGFPGWKIWVATLYSTLDTNNLQDFWSRTSDKRISQHSLNRSNYSAIWKYRNHCFKITLIHSDVIMSSFASVVDQFRMNKFSSTFIVQARLIWQIRSIIWLSMARFRRSIDDVTSIIVRLSQERNSNCANLDCRNSKITRNCTW